MKPGTKLKKWYEGVERSLQMMDRDIAYEKKVAAIQNLPYEPHWSTLQHYGDCKMIMNEIDTAKMCYSQFVQILLKDIQSPEGLTPFWKRNYDLPFEAYLGGNREKLIQFASIVLSDIEIRSIEHDLFQEYQECLMLSYFIGDKERTDKYLKLLEEKIDPTKFGEDGFPVPKGGLFLSLGHALYYKEMIIALMNKDTEKFTRNLNMESAFGFRYLKANEYEGLFDKELTVLYDIALGEGMRPKPDTQFIPKAVLENGYWNHP